MAPTADYSGSMRPSEARLTGGAPAAQRGLAYASLWQPWALARLFDIQEDAGKESLVVVARRDQRCDSPRVRRQPSPSTRAMTAATADTTAARAPTTADRCPPSLERPRVEGSTRKGEPRWQRPRSRPNPTRLS